MLDVTPNAVDRLNYAQYVPLCLSVCHCVRLSPRGDTVCWT